MSTDPRTNLDEMFPLPSGYKLRTKKFGSSLVSPLVSASIHESNDDGSSNARFKIAWDDRKLGLKVVVQEGDTGRLIAHVFCADAGLLKRAAVSVALVGNSGDHFIRKSIPLNVKEENGCSGSADYGPLSLATKELGNQLALVVFLMVDQPPERV